MNVDRDLVRVAAPPILAACVVALLLEVPGPSDPLPAPSPASSRSVSGPP